MNTPVFRSFLRYYLALILIHQVNVMGSFAQVYSEFVPKQELSSAEFNVLFGDPLVVVGSLSLVNSEVEAKIFGPENLEFGLIKARVDISKIVYASPDVLKNFAFVNFDEGQHNELSVEIYAVVSRLPGSEVWAPDWSHVEVPELLTISRSDLCQIYYIDMMHQSRAEDTLRWLENRMSLLDKWNSGAAERIRESKNLLHP